MDNHPQMHVKILTEAGYPEAILGLSLVQDQPVRNMPVVAERLATKDGSEYLEQMFVWLQVSAPQYWWQELADTDADIAKQRQSPAHTLLKRRLRKDDFAYSLDVIALARLNNMGLKGEFELLSNALPSGFMCSGVVCCSYKTLQRIILRHRSSPLREWQVFINAVLDQAKHKNLLPGRK